MEVIKQFYPSITIKRKPPINLQSGDDALFGGPDYTYQTSASNLRYYKNAIVTQNGVVLSNLIPLRKLIVCYDQDFKKYQYRYIAHVPSKTQEN
jgi:hypothetical protein